jgi:hypothetical protein
MVGCWVEAGVFATPAAIRKDSVRGIWTMPPKLPAGSSGEIRALRQAFPVQSAKGPNQ